MKLKGKKPSPIGKNRKRQSSNEDEKEPIDRTVVREQIDQFVRILMKDFPRKIVEIDQLRRKEFNYERMKLKCLTTETELERYFPKLNSKVEIDKYQQMYTIADFSSCSFLFPNGMIPINRSADELVQILLDQLEDLQRYLFECCMTIELIIPSYEKRSAFEYSLLQDLLSEFRRVLKWANTQYGTAETLILDFHGQEMIKIANYPQYEDLRKAFIRSEKKQLKELVTIVNYLFFLYLTMMDIVCKNGDKLGMLLTKARNG
ncbi:hypothetical protein RDWZM_004682 [Blomia tropicalis]|uniref:Proteasome activator PA28 C-terminal domain-containing protein n=1 Tax=Blomia tropicalis TaxID=40697 RepID=A0A9Q0M7N1_BLOTA|nr:Amine oxidase, copper containing [Blomia tropicalis]KAJ6218870.1 hypothetical protein RDWZM_004682 [Blomia tropicalis]